MSRGRILIVEDESLVAEDLQHCLSSSGYEVVGIADTFSAAKSIAESSRPDLALLDIRLKGPRDGIELADELRRQDIGYVYLTSHSDEGTLARAEVTEPLGYVLKPFGPREMLPVLRTAMYRHLSDLRQRNMDQWLRTTLRSIGDGVLVTDGDRNVTYLNPVAERMVGRSLRQVLGQPLTDVLRLVGADGKPPACVAARALAQSATVALDPDVELIRPDGTRLPVDDCAAPIREEGGQVSGVVLVVRDATASRKLERQRLEAERRMQEAERLESLGVLASGLAHDLNNILTAILGNAALARDGAPSAPDGPLSEIENNARAAADLCRRMLAGTGAAPIDLRPVDVDASVRACVARERSLAAEVGFVVTGGAGDLEVAADELQWRQVLQNLLRNAVEALAGRTGTVRVQWAAIELPRESLPESSVAAPLPPGRYLQLEVIDDGPGMAADVRARVFEPFFTTKFSGRGLGLASVHGIVRRHGGAIEVESEVGSGSCFRVFWPLTPGSTPASAAPARSGGRVLVIDDDSSVRAVTVGLLRRRGWHCEQAESGDHALAMLATGLDVDGILLDMMMPGLTTAQVLAALRAKHPRLPVLLLSGNGDGSAYLSSSPPVDFLAKPYQIDELLARIAPWARVTR
jgi:two-component system cell cycle sensor histidine kinase/response regulator CckA